MQRTDVSIYDGLPVTVIVYEVVTDEAGLADYRLVYGNRRFVADYERIYGRREYLGKGARRDHLVDEYTLEMMDRFRQGEPRAFSTYILHAGLPVHM